MSLSQEERQPREAQGPEAAFRAYLAAGRFMIQRGRESGACVFYPRVFAPGDAAGKLDWVEASGRATVYATTVTRRRPDRGGDYNVFLVELAEGPRLMSRVVGIAPGAVRIGMALDARIETLRGEPAVVVVPAREDAA
ncbi:OB-fold domain-containing protein [soil metagenome]